MVAELVTALAIVTPGDHPPPHITEPRKGRLVCNRACRQRRYWRRVVRPHRATLDRIARCESGRRWHIATGNGFYGGLQFTLSSWRAAGGSGYPHWATRLEQQFRAVKLMWLQGWGAWPVCRYA